MHALTFSRFGPPQVLEYREVPDPVLQPGQAIVQLEAIGLNFADVYRRQGRYTLRGEAPFIAGYEGAGTVLEVAPNAPFRVGDRVAFCDSPFAHAQRVAVHFDHLIALPDDISCETASALLLQGLTADYLIRDSHRVMAGEWVLVHAAAGGVGLLLVQLARAQGGRVLGLTSSAAKARAVEQAGAEAVVLYDQDWVKEARAQGGGAGMDGVYDSVGTTLTQSLEAARTRGTVVFYGFAGGDPALVNPRVLMDRSLTLIGGDLWNVLSSAFERRSRAQSLFERVRSGQLVLHIAARIPLAEGARAHELLESRQSVGKVLLIP